MSIMSDFFQCVQESGASVFSYRNDISPGVTMRLGRGYGVFLDWSQLPTSRKCNSVLGHECAHLKTGTLHKVTSPFEIAERNEHKAKKCFTETYLPYNALLSAMQNGCTMPHELASFFDVEENDIRWAINYYVENCGLEFADKVSTGP